MGKFFILLLISCFVPSFYACHPVEGCTDPNSTTYDPSAEKDDGSCKYANLLFYLEKGSDIKRAEISFRGTPLGVLNQPLDIADCFSAGTIKYQVTDFSQYTLIFDIKKYYTSGQVETQQKSIFIHKMECQVESIKY